MQVVIDARGLSCPVPQMRVLDAIHSLEQEGIEGEIVILVDEAAARDSVIRTARALGLPYRLEKVEQDFRLTLKKEELWITKLTPGG